MNLKQVIIAFIALVAIAGSNYLTWYLTSLIRERGDLQQRIEAIESENAALREANNGLKQSNQVLAEPSPIRPPR